MKHSPVLMLLLLFSMGLMAQEYTIATVKGVVFYKGVALKRGDRIDGLDNVSAASADAGLRVMSPEKGTFPITFQNGKKVPDMQTSKHGEFYQLVVQEYINQYVSNRKSLTTRGNTTFDWFTFFVGISRDTGDRRLLITEALAIPLTSTVFVPKQSFRLMAVQYAPAGDSAVIDLPADDGVLRFPAAMARALARRPWKLKIAYTTKSNDHKVLTITDTPLHASCLSHEALDEQIAFFLEDWKEHYTTKDDAIQDLHAWLRFNYGAFYQEDIDRRAVKALNAAKE